MNVKQLIACAGLISGGFLALGSNPAHAVGFSFTSECKDPATGQVSVAVCNQQAPDKDIILDLVEYVNPNTGQTERRNDLTLVNQAYIVNNEVWTGGNTGAASADQGVNSTIGLSKEDVTAQDIANDDPNTPSALTNRNLNSIVDTEDTGDFAIDLIFQHAVDNILLWERGMNSRLEIQAIGKDGEVVEDSNSVFLGNRGNGGVKEGFTPWDYAGYDIATKEIQTAESLAAFNQSGNPDDLISQAVGSRGVNKTDFGLGLDSHITGIRLISRGEYRGGWYNGPDWKVMGTMDPNHNPPQDVPEPFALAGLAVVGGAIATRRRQS